MHRRQWPSHLDRQWQGCLAHTTFSSSATLPSGPIRRARLTALLGCRSGVQGLALGSLVDCEFRNEEATLRSYLVTLARINV